MAGITLGTDAIAIAIIITLLTCARAGHAGEVSGLEEVATDLHSVVVVALTALSTPIRLHITLLTVRRADWMEYISMFLYLALEYKTLIWTCSIKRELCI